MAFYLDETAPEPRRGANPRKRVLLIGAVAALLLGLLIGVVAIGSRHPAKPRPGATATATTVSYRPIPGDYQPLNRQQIAAAFAEGQRVYASEGLSGLANASIKCFERLGGEPGYGLMDYCLALDVYGAETYSAVAGDDAPASTWFGQGPVRRLAAVQALTAGATDANARMLDTSRAIQEVASAATPAPPPQPAVVNSPAPVQMAQGPTQSPTPTAPVVTPPSASIAPKTAAAPAKPSVATPKPPPSVLASRTPPPSRTVEPEAKPMPAPARQIEAPRTFRGPSFDCRFARSVTERMICGEPELAAADRRLAAAFNRAMAQTPDPRALRRQQDRWLAARERAGGDYDAVLDLYDIRTRELREEP